MTLISLIVMLAFEGLQPFKSEHSRDHAIEGIVCIILACIQPVMAFFRPAPETKFVVYFWLFFKKWAVLGLFFVYFLLFKQSLQF